MNMKKILCLLLALTLLVALVSCGKSQGGENHTHVWVEATCTAPKTCSICGETEGKALGHDMQPATGDQPAVCSRCGYVDVGSAENANMAASGTCGENLTWSLTDTGLLTVSGTGPMEDYRDILDMDNTNTKDPPWANGISVPVRAAVIEDGVTSVGVGAFSGCTELYSVSLPASVTEIRSSAFMGCSYLHDVSLSEGLTAIGDYAFYECSTLQVVTLPDSVTFIGFDPFCRCSALEGVAVKSGNRKYTSVDGVLFTADMSTLIAYPGGKDAAEYAIPQGVQVIGDGAFDSVANLQSVTIPEGVTTIGETAFLWSQIQSVTLPASVTTIADGAFSYCVNLQSVTLPEGVESLGDAAFCGSGIQSIVLPASVSSVGSSAFTSCSALEKIETADGNQHFTSVDGVLFSADMTALLAYPARRPGTDYTVPDGVTSIGEMAFFGSAGLENLTIPASVTSVGLAALEFCGSLGDIYFGGTEIQWADMDVEITNSPNVHYGA